MVCYLCTQQEAFILNAPLLQYPQVYAEPLQNHHFQKKMVVMSELKRVGIHLYRTQG